MSQNFSAPLLEASQLGEIFTSWELDCNGNDFKKPKRERWQPLYTGLLGFAVGTEPSDMANRLLQTQFKGISTLEHPVIHEEANPLFNLCRAMHRVLVPCGVEDFGLMDIVEPKPRRLVRICSALVNFINFRNERMNVYEAIKEEDENHKKQREVLMAENEELQKKINDIKSLRAQQEPHVQQVRAKLAEMKEEIARMDAQNTQSQKDTTDIKANQAEKRAQLSQAKEHLAAAKEENSKLASQIVQSPDRVKGEMERMENQLQQLQVNKDDRLAKLVDLQNKLDTRQQDDIAHAIVLITKILEKVEREKELLKKFHQLHDEASQGEHELQETNRKEQHLKRMIESKEGKVNKQALQHQNMVGEMHDTMDRLNREREVLRSQRGDEAQQIRSVMDSLRSMAQQDEQHAQQHTEQLDKMRNHYQKLKQQVDVYHNMLGQRWLQTQKQLYKLIKKDN